LNSKLLIASLFSAVTLAACGGDGGSSDVTAADASGPSTPAPVFAPAPAAGATFDAACPDAARKITLTNSTISGANTSVTNDNVTLRVRFPAGPATVMVCPLGSATAGFPAVPAALTALLTGSPAAAVVATGEFSSLTNKQLDISFDFGTQTADAIAAKKIVAYTIVNGAWARTALATTFAAGSTASSRVVTAPIEQAGFYTIE